MIIIFWVIVSAICFINAARSQAVAESTALFAFGSGAAIVAIVHGAITYIELVAVNAPPPPPG